MDIYEFKDLSRRHTVSVNRVVKAIQHVQRMKSISGAPPNTVCTGGKRAKYILGDSVLIQLHKLTNLGRQVSPVGWI